VFANGALKPGVDKEMPNRQKKWAIPATAQGNAVYIPEQYVYRSGTFLLLLFINILMYVNSPRFETDIKCGKSWGMGGG